LPASFKELVADDVAFEYPELANAIKSKQLHCIRKACCSENFMLQSHENLNFFEDFRARLERRGFKDAWCAVGALTLEPAGRRFPAQLEFCRWSNQNFHLNFRLGLGRVALQAKSTSTFTRCLLRQ
jgi:hypothetical protein